ncbi:MAG: ZIP family metal transporter [Bacteroidales bacterium]|jgi:zinc and cadmium transporter|nr:ZIP family metal transporter [Bacteroidales bacterium]MCK9449312.1 ZIP family metal transporter [Bacteroidales bacterium]MDD3701807.1 ZIP family metal transporter [Bacteroidales bacterium]MDY0369747.1 ZIP family metal transporter [Bacteroidales bacterium]
MELIYVLIALFAGSIGSIGLAALMLLLPDKQLNRYSGWLMYLAGGTLLGAAFLGMIPKALSLTGSSNVFLFILIGIVLFFLLEKIILWRSCQHEDCDRARNAAVPIILIGDGVHNAIDGIVIAASFLNSVELGVFVTISVMMHEIPQELGDFGILLQSGLSRTKALLLNMLSGATAIIAGVLAYFMLESMQALIPWALAFSASSFIYIALADLIPEMHRKTKLSESIVQLAFVIAGIALIYGFMSHH